MNPFLKGLLEDVLSGGRMFRFVTRTWNPISGCLHGCRYCWARKLAEGKLKGSARYGDGFVPRFNEGELRTGFRPGEVVFVSDMGDMFGSWVPKSWIGAVLNHIRKFPRAYFLFLTKNPGRYCEFLDEIPGNVILGATIETNRDDLYLKYQISKAPLPSARYKAIVDLDWDRKFVSIEPILDFDLEVLASWIEEVRPLVVAIGYDNYGNRLPEPPLDKTHRLISKLREFTFVITKTLRRAWDEGGDLTQFF